MSSTHSLEGNQFVLPDWFSNPRLPRWDGWSTGYTSEISPASEGLQSLFCVITHNHSHTAPITKVNRCYGNVCYSTFKNALQFMKESAIFIRKTSELTTLSLTLVHQARCTNIDSDFLWRICCPTLWLCHVLKCNNLRLTVARTFRSQSVEVTNSLLLHFLPQTVRRFNN